MYDPSTAVASKSQVVSAFPVQSVPVGSNFITMICSFLCNLCLLCSCRKLGAQICNCRGKDFFVILCTAASEGELGKIQKVRQMPATQT